MNKYGNKCFDSCSDPSAAILLLCVQCYHVTLQSPPELLPLFSLAPPPPGRRKKKRKTITKEDEEDDEKENKKR